MQLPALSIRGPDLGQALARAAQIKGIGMQNKLAEAKLKHSADLTDALSEYAGQPQVAPTPRSPDDSPIAATRTTRQSGDPTKNPGFAKVFAADPKVGQMLIDNWVKTSAEQRKQLGQQAELTASYLTRLKGMDPTQASLLWPQIYARYQAEGGSTQNVPRQFPGMGWVNQKLAVAQGVKEALAAEADTVWVQGPKGRKAVPKYQLGNLPAGTGPYEKPTALQAKINTLVETGVPLNIAKGIAAGRYAKDRDPISGALQVVDMSTGKIIYRAGEDDQVSDEQPANLPRSALKPNVDYSQGTGASGAFGRIGNVVSDVLGMGLVAPEAEDAAQGLKNLQIRTQTMLQDTVPGRPSRYLLEKLGELTVTPNSLIQGDTRSQIRLQQTRDMLHVEVTRMETEILGNPGAYKPDQISKTRASVSQLKGILADYDVVLKSFKEGGSSLSKDDEDLVNKYLGGG